MAPRRRRWTIIALILSLLHMLIYRTNELFASSAQRREVGLGRTASTAETFSDSFAPFFSLWPEAGENTSAGVQEAGWPWDALAAWRSSHPDGVSGEPDKLQADKVQELFDRWDRDGSGELSLDEFRKGVQSEEGLLAAVAADEPQRWSFRDALLERLSPISSAYDYVYDKMTPRLSATWSIVVNGVNCWGDGCRVVWNDGASFVGSAPSAAWRVMMNGEGRVVYSLFARQLAVLVPNFLASTQIEADIFLQRCFWLRNLSVSPAAASLVIALAPPGLNFTRFWISDVKVSWNNLMALDSSPIVVEIDSVWADASEEAAGSPDEVEQLITSWLHINGGSRPDPFKDKYPLLDAATFRVRRLELSIASPKRYGQLSVSLRGLEARAVNEEGHQLDLLSMLKVAVNAGTVKMSRLMECSQASVRYVSGGTYGALHGISPVEVEKDARQESGQFLLAPTPVSALLTQTKNTSDLRQILHQRWTISFPSTTRILAMPPLFSSAPEIPPRDLRLSPYEGPTPEWNIQFANGDQFDWIFSSWRQNDKKAAVARIGAGVVVTCTLLAFLLLQGFVVMKPRLWLLRLLG